MSSGPVRRCGCGDVVGLQDVELECLDARIGFRQLAEQIFADVGGIDLRTFLGHGQCRSTADALRRRCHDRGLAFEPVGHGLHTPGQPIFRRLPSASSRDLSMTNDELCYLTARDALALFSERKVSPVDLMKAVIARAEKVQGEINCFADRYFDEALEAGQEGRRPVSRKAASRGRWKACRSPSRMRSG